MSGPFLIVLLLLAILFIIWGTARAKWHPFLVLLLAAYGLGLSAGLDPAETTHAITSGFGGTLGYIGIVIAAGTIIGTLLERSGGALVMANTVLRWIGKARAVFAMSVTGAVVSIPVFCDSGFIILSPLNRSLADQTKQSVATFAIALSMGLYTTHVFVPPTPGPIAAAGELGADIGTVILFGLLTTIPVLIVTSLFARYMGSRIEISGEAVAPSEKVPAPVPEELPRPWQAFAPVLVPVLLIALQSIVELPSRPLGEGMLFQALSFLGDPNSALLIGVVLAFFTIPERGPKVYSGWVGDGLKAAGSILLITGAGGALGRVLQTTPIGSYLGETMAALELGVFSIFLPFLIAAALKTTLGSSTVAIITAASIVAPLLDGLGLTAGLGVVLVTLAIGAGAMTVSHANDSYFWVVSQFSGMAVSDAYKLHTVGSAVAGVTGIIFIFVLSLMVL